MSFDPRDTITVTGIGVVTAVPDVARLRIAIEHSAPAVGDALDAVSQQLATAIALARELGLTDKDIASGQLSLNQQYAENGHEVRGYTVSQNLTLTVRDLPTVGPLVTQLGQRAGSSLRIHGLGIEIADTIPLQKQAREVAISTALEQATTLARLAGRRVGDAVVIEADAASSQESFASKRMLAASFAPEAGEQEVRATVRVTYELT